MAGTSVSGLVSGLDTASIISQLMQIEARPQTLLKQQAATGEKAVTALQAVNTKLAALKTAADKLSGTATAGVSKVWNASTVSSTAPSVGVSATGTTAASGSVSFDVLSLARAHSVTSAEFSDISEVVEEMPPVITVTRGGVTTEIRPDSGSAADIQKAVREADIGMQASLMQVGPDRYRLVLTAKEAGADNAFEVTGIGQTTLLAQGSDATLDLGNGVVARSTTGTFTDLLPGVRITPTAVESGVTVSAGTDATSQLGAVQAMVDAANAVLDDIAAKTAYVAGGTTSVLSGDSAVRGVANALTGSVNTVSSSPSAAGIQLTRYGKVELDTEKLTQLLATDPEAAQQLISDFATRVSAVAEAASGTKGSITTAISNKQTGIASINDQVEAWDDRLVLRKQGLEKQYAALEVALGKLSSQQSWLTSQLAGLSSS